MTRFCLFLGGALLTLASLSSAAKFYKWVDDNGVTHYGASPPLGVQAIEVNTRTSASSDQERAIDSLNAKREASARAKAADEQRAEEKKRMDTEPDAVARERCEQHQKNLDTLKNKPIVRQDNPETGEMEVLDQEARNKMIVETQEALNQCQGK